MVCQPEAAPKFVPCISCSFDGTIVASLSNHLLGSYAAVMPVRRAADTRSPVSFECEIEHFQQKSQGSSRSFGEIYRYV